MADIQQRHAQRLGRKEFARFKQVLTDITTHQRDHHHFAADD